MARRSVSRPRRTRHGGGMFRCRNRPGAIAEGPLLPAPSPGGVVSGGFRGPVSAFFACGIGRDGFRRRSF